MPSPRSAKYSQSVALARDHIESSRRRVLDVLENMSVIA